MKLLKRIFPKLRLVEKTDFIQPFLSKHYQLHNIARLSHLDSLGLDLNGKSVIEFGAGIGDHTYFYLIKKCDVLSTDARPELIDYIEKRFGNKTMILDVDNDLHKILDLPKFDIVHCYGLLYHISNPKEFLLALKGKGSLLILETCVSSDYKPADNYLVSEDKNNPTQAFTGKGSRPTRQWIFSLLSEIFPFVYVPLTQPDHPEFPKDWTIDNQRDNQLIRSVFIASEVELCLPSLTKSLPQIYY